jgi:hypothetical protein
MFVPTVLRYKFYVNTLIAVWNRLYLHYNCCMEQTVLTLQLHVRVLDLNDTHEDKIVVASSLTEVNTKGAHRTGLNLEALASSNI